MYQMIIGLPRGEFEDEEFPLSGSDSFGLEAETVTYLNGSAAITVGTAATEVTEDVTDVEFGDGFVENGTKTIHRGAATDFIADMRAGFVTIDSSDAEWLWKRIGIRAGATIARAEIRLDQLIEAIDDTGGAEYWHMCHDDGAGAQMTYHDHADPDAAGHVAQIGFEHMYDGELMYGVAAASGYVALFDDHQPELVGRWLRDLVIPNARPEPEDDTQQTELP
jgi:hypothetical protein